MQKTYADCNEIELNKNESVFQMTYEENEKFIHALCNQKTEFHYLPSTKQFTMTIRFRNEEMFIPIFSTYLEAKIYGLGNNDVYVRDCNMFDSGKVHRFYIPNKGSFNANQ